MRGLMMDKSPQQVRRDEAARERGIERIAVVFAHGQGEQVPMEDVIALAKTVWTETPQTHVGDDRSDEVWSVPIYDADMSEQRRLVTGLLKRPGQRDMQVDFYQFYWADLMVGNRFYHLWRWFTGLMARDPATAPPPLRPVRRLIMLAALIAAIQGQIMGALTALQLAVASDPLSWATFYLIVLGAALTLQGYWLVQRRHRLEALMLGQALIVGSILLGWGSETLVGERGLLLEAFTHGTDIAAWSVRLHSFLSGVLLVFGLLSGWALWKIYDDFLVPVMADSARMFSDSPENVPCRDHIRKRGMELFEALHYSDRHYDRIVVLAHSLGTAVVYNVLSQYWGNVYRLLNHEATRPEREAVEAAAAALVVAGNGLSPDPTTHPPKEREALQLARREYRRATRAYFAALRDEKNRLPPDHPEWDTAEFTSAGQLLRTLLRRGRPHADGYSPPWLISDFITVGSPMTYGGFLMAQSVEQLTEQFVMRRYALCPPDMEDSSFTFKGKPHHGAVFAATCWTNLFFEAEKVFWRGDIIGGPVAGPIDQGRFGWGPLDAAIKRHPAMPNFAHCEYWKAGENEAYLCTGKDPVLSEHVIALRSALSLFGDSWVDEPVLEFLAPPRTDPRRLHDFADGLRAAHARSQTPAGRKELELGGQRTKEYVETFKAMAKS